jgi:hypothetical protein
MVLIALANIVAWGVIVGLMFRLDAGQQELADDLTELEKRLGDS